MVFEHMIVIPASMTATAGGITKMPTSQSATARLITKQLVTVRKRRVVITAKITSVLPIIVITMSRHSRQTSTSSVQSQSVSDGSVATVAAVALTIISSRLRLAIIPATPLTPPDPLCRTRLTFVTWWSEACSCDADAASADCRTIDCGGDKDVNSNDADLV